jgi:hypothetical protein
MAPIMIGRRTRFDGVDHLGTSMIAPMQISPIPQLDDGMGLDFDRTAQG